MDRDIALKQLKELGYTIYAREGTKTLYVAMSSVREAMAKSRWIYQFMEGNDLILVPYSKSVFIGLDDIREV